MKTLTTKEVLTPVVNGSEQLTVPKVKDIIRSVTIDKSINLQEELAPIKDLFKGDIKIVKNETYPRYRKLYNAKIKEHNESHSEQITERPLGPYDPDFGKRAINQLLSQGIGDRGKYILQGELKDGISATQTATTMLRAFLYSAQKLYDAVGEADDKRSKALRGLAIWQTSRLAGEQVLLETLDKYEGTSAVAADTSFTHIHFANYDIEAKRLGAMNRLFSYLNHRPIFRRLFKQRVNPDIEANPLASVEKYLEGYYDTVDQSTKVGEDK